MEKNLILTGWFHPEYAAGAAAALEALRGHADVFGCSMAKLAGELADRGPRYAAVYVLGIGLTTNLEALASALRKLREAGTKTFLLSHVRLEENARAFLEDTFGSSMGFTGVCIKEKLRNLVEVAGEFFETLDDKKVKAFARFAIKVPKSGKEAHADEWAFQYLFEAAGYFHRECKNDFVYGNAIRQLWDSPRKCDLERNTDLANVMQFYADNGGDEIVGKCPAIRKVLEQIDRAAKYDDMSVLILGESGSGKDLVAKQLHRKSRRFTEGKGDLASGNCACLGGDLASSLLFGHKKGAFTGADSDHDGLFVQANDSTLFLDEIGELPLATQAMLLRTLSSRVVIPVGGDVNHPIPVNVRLVTATNRNLPERIRKGMFRQDLFQRIATVIISIPPLRERGDDLRLIAEHFWRRITEDPKARLTSEQLAALRDYSWPGNVRELDNVLKRAYVLGISDFRELVAQEKALMRPLENGVMEDGVTKVELVSSGDAVLPPPKNDETAVVSDIPDDQEAMLRWHASKIYEKCHHNLTASAEMWGTSVNTFKKYVPRA